MTAKKPFRILLTSAGTATAIGVIKGLMNLAEFEIHTTDINPRQMLPVDAFPIASHSVAPLASQRDQFTAFIARIVAEKSIDFIFPIHDEEIRALAHAGEKVLSAAIPTISGAAVDLCTDKLRMGKVCLEHGVPSPLTLSATEFGFNPFFPAFAKPRRGVGSANVKLLHDQIHLDALNFVKSEMVFQEVCTGPEVTVDALSTPDGVVAVARERLEVKSGVATKCRVWYSSELEHLANGVSRAFDLSGIFCFQVMTAGKKWAVTDINPRSGGATAMTLAAGINLYEEYFRIQLSGHDSGRLARLRNLISRMPETIVTRYYQEHVHRV